VKVTDAGRRRGADAGSGTIRLRQACAGRPAAVTTTSDWGEAAAGAGTATERGKPLPVMYEIRPPASTIGGWRAGRQKKEAVVKGGRDV